MRKGYAVFLRCKTAGTSCWLDPLHTSHLRESFATREEAEAGLVAWRARYPKSRYYIHKYDGE